MIIMIPWKRLIEMKFNVYSTTLFFQYSLKVGNGTWFEQLKYIK